MSAKTRSPLPLLMAITILTSLLASGCGSDDASQAVVPADVEYVIEPGALARQLRGQVTELIPSEIALVAGQSIVIHNQDQALHYFLSTPVWPGETLTKTFDEPGIYRYGGAFTCSVGSGTSLTVSVSDRADGSK